MGKTKKSPNTKESTDSTSQPSEVKKEDVVKASSDDKNTVWDCKGCVFNLPNRYKVLEVCGSGAYGTVVSAIDTKKGPDCKVAIKKIERTFEHYLYAKRTLREIKILRLLQHDNVINIKSIIKPESMKKFNEIYVVFEMMETDLATIIRSDQELSLDHVKFFMYQLLRGMKYVHSAGILHRDLKPRNLLVNSNCDLKICDFGLARCDIPEIYEAGSMTDYVSTRWYRAPELLFGSEDYNTSVDIWAIGCIFAELLTRKPFLPGSDSENQLKLICQMIGNPDKKLLKEYNSEILKLPKEVAVVKNGETSKFIKRFSKIDSEARDLLKKFLAFDPKKRITIQKALEHDFFNELHCEEDEPTTNYVSAFDFDFEKYELDVDHNKVLLYDEIKLYHSAKAQKKYLENRELYPGGMLHLKFAEETEDDTREDINPKNKMKELLAA